jgi:tetratricopeptide (TPR) repeat protein
MKKLILLGVLLLQLCATIVQAQSPAWFTNYQRGESLARQGDYQKAALHFLKAIKVKGNDNEREKLSGTRTIPYFPRRELGICLFYLGIHDFAEEELRASIKQNPSDRARTYLKRLNN